MMIGDANKMNRIISEIIDKKIIVIVRGLHGDKLLDTARAMYDGGIRLIEVTYDRSGKIADETVAENIKMLRGYFADSMYIGAGTVTDERKVELTYNAGGQYIISPDVNTKVISKTKSLGMVSIPGAMTPTEICTANDSGADFVKVFPVTNMGVEYIRAIRAPLSDVRLLAVGGINENNMADYLAAGVCGFGIGSNIVNTALIESDNYTAITNLAEKYVSALSGVV